MPTTKFFNYLIVVRTRNWHWITTIKKIEAGEPPNLNTHKRNSVRPLMMSVVGNYDNIVSVTSQFPGNVFRKTFHASHAR